MDKIKKIRDFSLGKYKIQHLTRKTVDSLNPKRFVFEGQIYDNNFLLKEFTIRANHFGDFIEELKKLYPIKESEKSKYEIK